MPKVSRRHLAGAFVGGLVGGILVLILASAYSVQGGFTVWDPYYGIGGVLGYTGNTAFAVGLFVDLLIPMVLAFLMVGVLWVLSRTPLRFLEFTSPIRAGAEGAAVGVLVFFLFYVPVIEDITHHPMLSAIMQALEFGFVEHLIFAAATGIVIYLIGGPVTFKPRPGEPAPTPAPSMNSGS